MCDPSLLSSSTEVLAWNLELKNHCFLPKIPYSTLPLELLVKLLSGHVTSAVDTLLSHPPLTNDKLTCEA